MVKLGEKAKVVISWVFLIFPTDIFSFENFEMLPLLSFCFFLKVGLGKTIPPIFL